MSSSAPLVDAIAGARALAEELFLQVNAHPEGAACASFSDQWHSAVDRLVDEVIARCRASGAAGEGATAIQAASCRAFRARYSELSLIAASGSVA